jgi:hypothetical protein
MHKKLTASAVTGFLLLGAAGVAMAQTPPPEEGVQLVVFGVQTTSNVVVDPPIVAGDPCVEAVQALRGATPALSLRDTAVIQESFLTFFFVRGGGLRSALLVCAPEGTEPPPVPAPA